MAVYTLINNSQLQSLLAYYDLGELTDYKPIQAGTTNSNYEITVNKKDHQAKYVFTIIEQNLSKKDLEFCLDYAELITKHDVPAAAAIKDRAGHNYRMFLNKNMLISPYISGESFSCETRQEISNEHFKTLGKNLAKMHRASTKIEQIRKNPAGFKWCLNTSDDIADFVTTEQDSIIKDEISFLIQNHEAVLKAKLSKGAIHADLFMDNVLFQHNRLSGIIDFYYACTDYYLYDLAIVVNDWVIDTAGRLNQLGYSALIQSYLEELSQDSELHKNLIASVSKNTVIWQYMLRLAAFRFYLLRLSATHLPRASNIKTVKDPLEYEIKLILHRSGDLALL